MAEARQAGSLWTAEEDVVLLRHVAKYGTKHWGYLQTSGILPHRDQKACCNRFILLKRKFFQARSRGQRLSFPVLPPASPSPSSSLSPSPSSLAPSPATPSSSGDGQTKPVAASSLGLGLAPRSRPSFKLQRESSAVFTSRFAPPDAVDVDASPCDPQGVNAFDTDGSATTFPGSGCAGWTPQVNDAPHNVGDLIPPPLVRQDTSGAFSAGGLSFASEDDLPPLMQQQQQRQQQASRPLLRLPFQTQQQGCSPRQTSDLFEQQILLKQLKQLQQELGLDGADCGVQQQQEHEQLQRQAADLTNSGEQLPSAGLRPSSPLPSFPREPGIDHMEGVNASWTATPLPDVSLDALLFVSSSEADTLPAPSAPKTTFLSPDVLLEQFSDCPGLMMFGADGFRPGGAGDLYSVGSPAKDLLDQLYVSHIAAGDMGGLQDVTQALSSSPNAQLNELLLQMNAVSGQVSF